MLLRESLEMTFCLKKKNKIKRRVGKCIQIEKQQEYRLQKCMKTVTEEHLQTAVYVFVK